MGLTDTQRLTHAAPVPRLGLRARWRAVREARMVSPRARRQLAKGIENVVDRADAPRWPLTAVIPVAPEAGRGARGALLDLAERLRGPRPVAPEGMRLARALLIEGGGPLYVPGEPGELRAAVLRALWALDRRGVADR
jgi:hypothetical protein